MPTQRDIAEKLGVSVTTVSLALRRDPQISVEMQSRILETAKRVGYIYKPRKNVSSSAIRLAFVTSYNMTLAFYSTVLDAAVSEAQKMDATLRFIQTAQYGPLKNLHNSSDLDGLLLIGTFGTDVIEEFKAYHIPILLIDNNCPDIDLDRVNVDNEESLYRSVMYLYDFGHRSIAYINGPDYHWSFYERLLGYQRAIQICGLEPVVIDSGDEQGTITFEGTERELSSWLQKFQSVPFTALIACNDKAAIGAIHAIQNRGLRIPEDVSIIGFDDIEPATVVKPGLTTNHVFRDVLGRMSVRLLVERILHPELPALRLTVGTRLIERESTGLVR